MMLAVMVMKVMKVMMWAVQVTTTTRSKFFPHQLILLMIMASADHLPTMCNIDS